MRKRRLVERKQGNRRNKQILLLSSLLSLGIFMYAAFQLVMIHVTYQNIANANEALRREVLRGHSGSIENDKTNFDFEFLRIDWETLRARNADVVGWVYVPGTNINYPILQGENDDTYLHHDIDALWSAAGSIFMDERNNPDFMDLNTIIYGHNMLNGSMFSELEDFVNDRYKEMPTYIHIYLPTGPVFVYQIVSAHIANAFSNIYALPVIDLKKYYALMLEGSIIDVAFDSTELPRVLTLSTCENNDMSILRLVIHGVLIHEIT